MRSTMGTMVLVLAVVAAGCDDEAASDGGQDAAAGMGGMGGDPGAGGQVGMGGAGGDPGMGGMGGDPGAGGMGGQPTVVPDLVGEYVDAFDTRHSVGATWSQTAGDDVLAFHIIEADDAAHWAIARNDETNAFNPGLFSRFDWTLGDDQNLWFCQTAYDAADAAAARATPAADAADPANAGCGGFAWTPLGPISTQLEGDWIDDFGTAHTIGADFWRQGEGDEASQFTLVQTDRGAGWAVAHNADTNAFSAGLWSRFDWVRDGEAVYVCQTRYDAATRTEAVRATPADATDPAAGGCADFAWSRLTPAP